MVVKKRKEEQTFIQKYKWLLVVLVILSVIFTGGAVAIVFGFVLIALILKGGAGSSTSGDTKHFSLFNVTSTTGDILGTGNKN